MTARKLAIDNRDNMAGLDRGTGPTARRGQAQDRELAIRAIGLLGSNVSARYPQPTSGQSAASCALRAPHCCKFTRCSRIICSLHARLWHSLTAPSPPT